MKYTRAFTLMELAIVLVVIGLIAGAITGGQALIRGSELRAIAAEKEKYTNAVNAFVERYRYLPGDIPNAIKIWGAAHATPATCRNTVGTGTQTCDGNGDGRVAIFGTGPTYYEIPRAWQHLAIAGMIEGSFTGTAAGVHLVPGLNGPATKISNMTWTFVDCRDCPVLYGGHYWDTFKTTHMFQAGTEGPAASTSAAAFVTPEEAWSIDMKIDDGLPAAGSLYSLRNTFTPNCNTTNVSSTTRYNVTYTGIACNLNFKYD